MRWALEVRAWQSGGRQIMVGLAVATLLASCATDAEPPPIGPSAAGPATFISSDAELNAAFQWAQSQALAYAFEGDEVGPWYEAALPEREAFCMRDASHQAIGAHVLGLQAHNLNMFGRFAENISDSKDWASYWEINRHNKPAPVDYKNDNEFWYNLPANFDVLDASWRLFSWTGDHTYLDSPEFENFYRRTVDDYVVRWDLGLAEIMERDPHMNLRVPLVREDYYRVARGLSTYDESDFDVLVGVDLLAAQVAGYRAFANMTRIQGKEDIAAGLDARAAAVQGFIDDAWWSEEENKYWAFYSGSGEFEETAGRALLYWDVLTNEGRTASHLRHLVTAPKPNIESLSHYPEILYRYGEDEQAYRTLLYLSNPETPRREYPEVSFSVVGAIAAGMMGVEPDPASEVIATHSRLTSQTAWAELASLSVLGHTVAVRHDGVNQTTFRNRGEASLKWEARFSGEWEAVLVGGQSLPAATRRLHGRLVSSVVVVVNPGESLVAAVEP